MTITLQDIDAQIDSFDDHSATTATLRAQVMDLTNEVDEIKQTAEAYALETSATSTGVPKVKKDFLAKHDRYNTAVQELRRAGNDLSISENLQESSRMRAWARIAILQNRDIKPSEQHNHPIDSF